MIDNLTDIHDYGADDLVQEQNALTQDNNDLDFEHGADTDYTHEQSYGQTSNDHYDNSENDYSVPEHNDEVNPYDSDNHSPNSSGYNANSEPDAYQHDDSASHLSFHSDSDDTVYHEHSGTVYHEHYLEKPKPYMGGDGGGETIYDDNATYGDSPEPVSNSCVDNNENGICDSSESGSDSGSSNDD